MSHLSFCTAFILLVAKPLLSCRKMSSTSLKIIAKKHFLLHRRCFGEKKKKKDNNSPCSLISLHGMLLKYWCFKVFLCLQKKKMASSLLARRLNWAFMFSWGGQMSQMFQNISQHYQKETPWRRLTWHTAGARLLGLLVSHFWSYHHVFFSFLIQNLTQCFCQLQPSQTANVGHVTDFYVPLPQTA